jgi:(1->4)-alpha-D-glucan 1-alpha-D-glucosylmutase
VDGTTGYELTRLIDQLFVDPSAQRVLGPLDETARGDTRPWHELMSDAKRQILDEVLGSERERLIDLAHRALKNRVELRDCTRHSVALAVSALLTSYPVYRTYVREGVEPSARDRALITAVVSEARHKVPEVDARVFSGLEHMLLLEWHGADERELSLRIQQSTGAVCAKAVEDTLFYRMTRLIALNEVGGTPEELGISPEAFHTALERWPYRCSMLASATHDTKRGEDTRARLFALSEVAEDFAACLERWSAAARGYRSELVDRATESFFFQTLVGAYPISLERAQRYMEKAMREAKLHTHWLRPNAAYEAAVQAFVQGALEDAELMADVGRFVARIAPGGYVTSLSRTLIKLTAPGAPDIYQGCELWDFALCDPDNRRPVDYAARATSLERVSAMSARQVMSELESGAAKQWLIWKTLSLRRQRPELFAGAYRRVQVGGADATRLIAFARGEDLISVVPRLNQRSVKVCDAGVHLPAGELRNVLTGSVVSGGAIVPASALLEEFPVALLTRLEP